MKRPHFWIFGAILAGAIAGAALHAATTPVTTVRFDDASQTDLPGARRIDAATLEVVVAGKDPSEVVRGRYRIVSRRREWAAHPGANRTIGQVLGLLAKLYLRLLMMVMVPLIFASMVSGMCGIGDLRSLGRIGGRTLLFYLMTVCIAVGTGLLLVNLIQPGRVEGIPLFELPEKFRRAPLTLYDLVLMAVPENIFRSMADGDVLPVITFSLTLGGIASAMGAAGDPIRRFFDALFEAMTRLTGLVLWFAPAGTFALVAVLVWETGFTEVRRLGLYIVTVLIGLAIHFVVLSLFVWRLGRRNPVEYVRQMSLALLTAFSTASSNATIPVSMECVEKRAGIPHKVAAFVLPVGATVNMDGTALYEAVAAMFIAQAWGIPMGFSQQLIVFATAALAAIGAAGIPGAGTVTMILVLNAVGLPVEGIAMILAVDRFLDMCRTTVNVYGDLAASAIVARGESDLPPAAAA